MKNKKNLRSIMAYKKKRIHQSWEKQQGEQKAGIKIYVKNVNQKVVDSLPSDTKTFVESDSIFDKVANVIKTY